MDQILDSPLNDRVDHRYAGFWIRFVAYIVDGIILVIVQIMLSYMLFGDYSMTRSDVTLTLLSVAIGIGYFAGMESSARQGTLGKILFKLKVGDANGNQISFANAIGRYFAKILSALILCIGFMMAGWDSKKQALHDKIAGTYVFEA